MVRTIISHVAFVALTIGGTVIITTEPVFHRVKDGGMVNVVVMSCITTALIFLSYRAKWMVLAFALVTWMISMVFTFFFAHLTSRFDLLDLSWVEVMVVYMAFFCLCVLLVRKIMIHLVRKHPNVLEL